MGEKNELRTSDFERPQMEPTSLHTKMSAARQENVARWNMYKSRVDAAGSAVIRATQFLVRPTDRFPACNLYSIDSLWRTWRDEEECFWRMTSPHDTAPSRSFPKMPAVDGQECCYRMWGLLIQVQIDGTHGSTRFLAETAQQIAANEKCKSHPETCACHVPNHPWVDREDMEALAPINPKHRLDCRCGGYTLFNTPRCKQKEAAAAATPLKAEAANPNLCAHGCVDCVVCLRPKTYDYKHNVETCACGVCHKSRVDSGTQEAYEARIRARQRPVAVQPVAVQESISSAACKADIAIMKASAASGGIDAPDFAKNLFAALGTPHDSLCPHRLPFYSCMPCSH